MDNMNPIDHYHEALRLRSYIRSSAEILSRHIRDLHEANDKRALEFTMIIGDHSDSGSMADDPALIAILGHKKEVHHLLAHILSDITGSKDTFDLEIRHD